MKWLDGPMRPMPPKGSVRIWTKRLCGEQVSLVWLFFSLLALALAAFPLIVDGRYTNGNWDVPAIALAAVGFGGICVGTRKILSIDLEKRSFEWRLNVLFPVRRCVGRLDHNCRFVVEESVGPIPGLDIFQRDPFQTLSFQSDSRKLKVLLVRTGTGLGLNWLRSLPDEFQIPVEIGTGSTRQIPEFAGYFPVATIKPPREVREETPDRLRIEPPPRRNTGITPLVGAVALLLISGADLLHFNAFAGVLEFLRVQSVRHPVLKIPAVVAAGAMIGLSLADWIGRRTDTLIEFEDGNLSVLAESPTGARKVIAKRHVSEIGTFMFDSGSAVSAPVSGHEAFSGGPTRRRFGGSRIG